jgi:hypothetical protein
MSTTITIDFSKTDKPFSEILSEYETRFNETLEPTRVDAYLRLNMSVPFENHLQHHLEIGEPVRDWDEFDNALWTSLDQKAETEPQSTTTSDPSTGSTPV